MSADGSRKSAPDSEVWFTGLKWVEAARMQLDRFDEAFAEQVRAEQDAGMRQHLRDDSERSRQWRESLDAHPAHDRARPLRVPTWSLRMQVAAELDFLIQAVRNVVRAQDLIPEPERPAMDGQRVLKLLRDVSEHFDDPAPRAGVALAEKHPEVAVGVIAYTIKEIWIGGFEGIPLSRVKAWLARVEVALIRCLQRAGVEVPTDMSASRFEGDDALAWPPERLRYHWSIPRLPESEWPRQEMPAELAELLAKRAANLRARDPED
jgi:hypothetical protein